jgi:hypothetical protein
MIDPVEKTFNLATVENADPPRFSQIEPTLLKSRLETKIGSKVRYEYITPGEHGSEIQWGFGTPPEGVEIGLHATGSHGEALHAMKNKLHSISAPLESLFVPIRIGQRGLKAVGPRGLIYFVRHNIFVNLSGKSSSEELSEIAEEIDKYLKEREGDIDSVPRPRLGSSLPDRRVELGETFDITLDAPDVGWVHPISDSTFAQLVETDIEHKSFKFHAGSKGTTVIKFILTHHKNLQNSTVTTQVVIE